MRQTLFRIPLDGPWSLGPLGDWPGFGMGIVLAVWCLVGGWWIVRHRREIGFQAATITPAIIWLSLAALIVGIPRIAQWNNDRAIANLSREIESSGENARILLVRGRLWKAKRRYQKAIDDFEKAVALESYAGDAHRELAWLLATCADEQFHDASRAVELAKTLPDFDQRAFGDREDLVLIKWKDDILAAAYARSGRFDLAVKTAEDAARAMRPKRKEKHFPPELSAVRKRLASYQAGLAYREPREGVSIPIRGYGFMLFWGFLIAGWVAVRRAVSVGIHPDIIWDLAICIFFSGIIGGRLFYLVQKRDLVFADKHGFELIIAAINLPNGGLVLYGGVLMAVAAYFIYCHRRKLNPLFMADVVVPSFFVGLAFGRIGCFFNGCCYGDRCELPWSVRFPMGSVPDMSMVSRGFLLPESLASLPLHPSQIYSSLNAIVLAFLTAAYFKHRNRDGSVLALGLLTYPVTRFVIEYLRGDELGKFNTSLTISQWVSLGLFAGGIVYVLWLTKRPVVVTHSLQAAGVGSG